MKKTAIKFVSIFTASLLLIPMFFLSISVAEAADTADGFTARVDALRSVYLDGHYWNHCVSEDRLNGDRLLAAWKNGDRALAEQFADSVTGTSCYTHKGTCPIGYYDCNVFDGGMQCWGFARKIFYDIFGVRCSTLQKDDEVSHVKAGSYVRLGSDEDGHSVFVLKREGNIVTVVECNYGKNDAIKWDRQFDITNPGDGTWFSYCYNVLNFDQVNSNPAGIATNVECTLTPECAPNMRLDVNGGSKENEANIQIFEANNTDAQKLIFEDQGDGYFRIISKASGKAVDVKYNNAKSGETVWQYECNGTDAQLWKIISAGDGYVYLIPKSNPDLRMDVKNRGTSNHTDVQVYEQNQTPAQRWQIRICY